MTTEIQQVIGSGPVLPTRGGLLPPIVNWVVGIIGLVILGFAVHKGSALLNDPERFPVTKVHVSGTLDYVNQEKLKELIEQSTEKGFFGLDISQIRQSIENLAWVSHARISRVLPSAIEVSINEYEPAARWNNYGVISKQHTLLNPPQLELDNPLYSQWIEVFNTLPSLEGANGRHTQLLNDYRQYNDQLSRFNISLLALKEDERLSQTLSLSNEIVVRLGYEQRSLRMQRFLDVYTQIAANVDNTLDAEERGLVVFDMRYSNGFSLLGVSRDQLAQGGASPGYRILGLN